MPALRPTDYHARVLWLGSVPVSGDGVRSSPLTRVELGWAGMRDERHSGLTRPSCGRVTDQHPRGTEIRNVRQLSIVSQEELSDIAQAMGLRALAPSWLGASMVLEGLPDLTNLPPSSRLQGPDGVTLVVDMANRPCNLPGREIEQELPGSGARFKAAAEGRRGVTAWVERPGLITLGAMLRLHVPDQPAWAGFEVRPLVSPA
ncbi:Putative metal-sulfur cluster biosynthesis proteins YuaD [Roseivivax jejudonensis]|uniref:Putative metal-sulfur cluster biosynthesis proteins YuaD n=1 Tax=Roseivivax jejudonensis TaxID=1529041 RepID=A0A1X7A157_9RHOB|nr:sulfurase [Roseivivax jejudonensis]SLN67637.1 Putative metal-sulfur cluster biosynthesis proteins YuaD [Roseivivax jejudonensis]